MSESDREATREEPPHHSKSGYPKNYYARLCLLDETSAASDLHKAPKEMRLYVMFGSQQAPPPAAANPLRAFSEASRHFKQAAISLMCCSSEGEQQAD